MTIEVPARVHEGVNALLVVLGDAFRAPTGSAPDRLHSIEGADHLIERSPGIDAGIDRDPAGANEDELLIEPVGHLRDPLELDTLRARRQGPAGRCPVPSAQ